MEAVTDLRDLRVLIPEVRRAIDGPQATSSASVTATLSDTEILGVIADATSEVILLTGGEEVFGCMLEVVERDAYYMAPIAWRTSAERSPNEDVVIRSQAAINFYLKALQETKISETIKDEGQEWSYNLSATLVRDQLAALVGQRDKALQAMRDQNSPLDTYGTFVHGRDTLVFDLIDPMAGGQGLVCA